MTDWKNVSSMDQTTRLKSFLADAAAAGIQWRKAAIIAAISINENGATPFMPNKADILTPKTCYPLRPVLMLERGGGTGTGTLKSAGVVFKSLPPSVQDWFTKNKYYDSAEDRLSVSATYDHLAVPNTDIERIFEFAMANRLWSIVSLFSIGMTSMYMALSPLAGGHINGRFATPDLLWTYYNAQDVLTMLNGVWYDYLATNVASYPTDASSRSTGQAYLEAYQTGSAIDWTSPTWSSYLDKFMQNVRWVWSLGRAMNYPGIA